MVFSMPYMVELTDKEYMLLGKLARKIMSKELEIKNIVVKGLLLTIYYRAREKKEEKGIRRLFKKITG